MRYLTSVGLPRSRWCHGPSAKRSVGDGAPPTPPRSRAGWPGGGAGPAAAAARGTPAPRSGRRWSRPRCGEGGGRTEKPPVFCDRNRKKKTLAKPKDQGVSSVHQTGSVRVGIGYFKTRGRAPPLTPVPGVGVQRPMVQWGEGEGWRRTPPPRDGPNRCSE